MSKKKFQKTMYVTAYQLARDGMSNKKIAMSLGVSGITFARWCANDEALDDALERGRDVAGGGDETFGDYVYRHLSPDMKELWEQINECEDLENGVERVEALLANGGKRARQHLFIHALATTCFNVSKAMHKLNVPRKTYDSWIAYDPGFAALIDEMHFHKKNFFEQAFIRRVQAGDTPAILHAVKSQLGDRGYSDKIQVEHTGTIEHVHQVNVAELPLPLETRVQILDAVEAHDLEQEKQGLRRLPAP